MCGIVGIATGYMNGLSWSEGKMFTDMLFLDQLRGFDSTGVFCVTSKGNVHIAKEASHASDFLQKKEYKEVNEEAVRTGRFIVGHNRAATRGSIKDENAHPFWVNDNIILVQNGSYNGSHKHIKDVEVDSHAIAHLLAEEEDIEKALKQVNAAYAFVWYNVAKKQLNIIRNKERPLWIAETENGGVVWASEFEFILFAASRQGIKLKGKPYMLAEHSLYQLTLDDDLGWTAESKDLDCGYKYTNFYQGAYNPAWKAYYDDNGGSDDTYSRPMVQQRMYDSPGMYNNKSLQYNLHTYVSQGKFRDEFMHPAHAEYLIDDLRGKIGHGERLFTETVEFFDYLPGNNFHDCRTWVVVGKNLAADDQGSLLYYYNLFDADERTAMEMIGKFYKCKLSTIVPHRFNNQMLGTVLIQEANEIKLDSTVMQ